MLSCCIIPFNRSYILERSLESLLVAVSFIDNYEVFVIDNSTDETEKKKNLKITNDFKKNNQNIIYYDGIDSKMPADAVNYLIEHASFKRCLVCADDVLFHKYAVKNIYQAMDDDERIVLAGFTSLTFQRDNIIESQGVFISTCTTLVRGINSGKKFDISANRALIPATHFNNAMVFDKTAGVKFDTSIGYCYEESDFSIRISKYGNVRCVSDAVLWHSLESIDKTPGRLFSYFKNINKKLLYYLSRNRIIFSRRHRPNKLCSLLLVPIYFSYFFILLIVQLKLVPTFFEGIRDGFLFEKRYRTR